MNIMIKVLGGFFFGIVVGVVVGLLLVLYNGN